LIQSLNKSLSPIVGAGPSQAGWSPQEAAAISTATINNGGAAARNATQAAQGALAGRGGDSGLQSGVDQQILSTIKSNSADQIAKQQTQNTIDNYTQGNQNFWKASGGVAGLAGLQSNNGDSAIGGSGNAFKQADTIQQEQNQEEAAIAGGIASIGMDAATFGVGAAGGGGFMGGLKGLTGQG
jgi:hypothetical protein